MSKPLDGWIFAWQSPPTAYSFMHASRGSWLDSSTQGLSQQNMGFSAANAAEMEAYCFRASGEAPIELPGVSDEVRFFLVLNGLVRVKARNQAPLDLTERDFGYQPPLNTDRVQLEPGSEVFVLSAPAKYDPESPFKIASDSQYVKDTPSAWTGDGLRSFFAYHDLCVSVATGDLVAMQLVKAIAECPKGGTGFHYHTGSQIIYILSGWLDVAVEGHGIVRISQGESACIAPGPGNRHNVENYSRDYSLFEMFVPARYETFATDAPIEFSQK